MRGIDLTKRVGLNSKDEIGDMAAAVDRFVDKLQPIARQNHESMPELIERAVSNAALQGIGGAETLTCAADNASGWSPFRALTYLQPPLPSQPELFALAVGLALCEERTSWSR